MPAQHVIENVGSETANRETRRFAGSRSDDRFAHALHGWKFLLAAAAGLRQIKGDANNVKSVANSDAKPSRADAADFANARHE
jgi:hypothetical protein